MSPITRSVSILTLALSGALSGPDCARATAGRASKELVNERRESGMAMVNPPLSLKFSPRLPIYLTSGHCGERQVAARSIRAPKGKARLGPGLANLWTERR